MKKLSEFITHNFGWKIVSLVAAIAMWFMIVNINNPTQERNFPVFLQVDGESVLQENSYVLLNADELKSTTISLRVRGSASNLNQLSRDRERELTAYIDLTPIDISRSSELGKKLPVRVKYKQLSTNYDILYSSPEEINVVLDKYVTRSIPVIIEKIDDDMEGYISLEPVVTPANISISGPLSDIGMIAEVRATIEVGEATEAFDVTRPVEILDAEGRDISEKFEVSAAEVDIHVGVETYARIPVSTPRTVGTVAEGYRVTAVAVSPREIEVEGNSAAIKAMSAIRLMDIDVTGISRTKVETYDMRAYLEGTNLSIREGAESRVRVTVTVEKEITKEILVPVDKIEIRGMEMAVSLPPGEVQLEVRGIASEIVKFEQSAYVSYIDVTGLEQGVYNLEVGLETPEGIVQTGTEAIEVLVGIIDAQFEPEEVPQEE